MTCTTTKACAAWAVAIVALTRLPSLDGFSPSAAAAASRSTLSWGVSGGSRHSNGRQSGRTGSPVPFISHNKKCASFFQLRASRDELESMAVKDLRQTVTDLGLPATDLNKMPKAELVEFLLQADEGESAVDEPVPIQATDLLGVAEEEESDADASSADFKEDVVSPGVKTLREFLTYSDYGIRKLQDQRQRGEAIRADIGDGKRDMPAYYFEDFVEEEEDREDDPNVIIADEWGSWDERDLAGPPMAGDWDPENDPNPNDLDPEFEYVTEIPKNEEGVEEGYDPMFGSWCKCCCCFSYSSHLFIFVAVSAGQCSQSIANFAPSFSHNASTCNLTIQSNLTTTTQQQTPSISVPSSTPLNHTLLTRGLATPRRSPRNSPMKKIRRSHSMLMLRRSESR